jgi:hypothetical protein
MAIFSVHRNSGKCRETDFVEADFLVSSKSYWKQEEEMPLYKWKAWPQQHYN